MVSYKSKQEAGLARLYPKLQYETVTLPYTIPTDYTPDFYLGNLANGEPVFIECKEWIAYADVTKYKHFCAQYPKIHLGFLIKSVQPRTVARLRKFAWDVVVSPLNVLPTHWYQYYGNHTKTM